MLLCGLTAAYLTSTASGLGRGIAVLSVVNVFLAVSLLAFVLAAGPTLAMLAAPPRALAAYLAELPRLSFVLPPEGAARQWSRDWSLTYFLWWVAWAPFVGVFVARISRGRTVRTFLAGVLLVPSLATLVWFSVLGEAALAAEAAGASLGVSDFETAPRATYALLATLPFPAWSQALTLLLVFLFLVTSADSGAYVLGLFGQDRNEPGIAHRLWWGVILAGMTGGALLSAGGQSVTRAMAVAGAVPLSLLLAGYVWVLVADAARPKGRRAVGLAAPSDSASADQNRRSKKVGSAPPSRA